MGTARADDNDQMEAAIDDLIELARGVSGVEIVPDHDDWVQVHLASGDGWPARVLLAADVREATVRSLATNEGRSNKILVADRMTEDARKALTELRWGWLDRSWGAELARAIGPPVYVHFVDRSLDASAPVGVPARLLSGDGSAAIRGRAAISLAAALLHAPEQRLSLRSVARLVGMSPQSMSNAARRLAENGLITADGRPVVPDLFDELAKAWRPEKLLPVAVEPDPSMFTALDSDESTPGVALGGDLAAAALGAPLVTADLRPWLWIPTYAELRRVGRRLQPASWDSRAGVLAVPPTPLVTLWRRHVPGEPWPVESSLFAALELAQVPGRGREILTDFHPDVSDPQPRVWT